MGHLIAAAEISIPTSTSILPLSLSYLCPYLYFALAAYPSLSYSAIGTKIAPRYKPRRYLLLLCY